MHFVAHSDLGWVVEAAVAHHPLLTGEQLLVHGVIQGVLHRLLLHYDVHFALPHQILLHMLLLLLGFGLYIDADHFGGARARILWQMVAQKCRQLKSLGRRLGSSFHELRVPRVQLGMPIQQRRQLQVCPARSAAIIIAKQLQVDPVELKSRHVRIAHFDRILVHVALSHEGVIVFIGNQVVVVGVVLR